MRFARQTKLKQLCLNVIVENMENYMYNDSIPQMHIDFLHRVYSNEVFKRISVDQRISEETMLWFLNPYSKVIFLSTVSEKIIERLKEIGSTISYLNLKETLATENMINSILCCIPNVTKLSLSDSLCSDKTMLCIQKMCPKVLNLNLEKCQQLSDQGMINLCGRNQCLEILNLKETFITSAGISTILKGFPSLKKLKKECFAEIFYQIHEVYVKQNLGKTCHYNITELIYDQRLNYNTQSVILLWIILCPNIEKVYLYFEANYYEIVLCSKFKKLKTLGIYSTNASEATSVSKLLRDPLVMTVFTGVVPQDSKQIFNILDPFTNMPEGNKLTKLTLCFTEIPTEALFECLRHLKTLRLKNVTFSEFDEENLKQDVNNLDALILAEVGVNSLISHRAVLKLLSLSQNVTVLHLCWEMRLSLEIFETILNSMRNLSYANLSFSTIDRPTALKFFRLPSLMTLCLDGCFKMNVHSDFQEVVSYDSNKSLSWFMDFEIGYSEYSEDD